MLIFDLRNLIFDLCSFVGTRVRRTRAGGHRHLSLVHGAARATERRNARPGVWSLIFDLS